MKFKIRDQTYDGATLDDLTLKMVLQLEKETREFGRLIRLADVQAMAEELDKLKTNTERGNHPDTPWVLAVTIWASRRLAGESVTFEEAIDFPMGELTFLKQPLDHLEPANPTRSRPRKGSGPVVKPAHASTKTLRPASIAG